MSSRVRKGVIGGLLVVGVGLSGCLVSCSGSESSSSDVSATSGRSRSSGSSTTTPFDMSERIDTDLSAHSLSSKRSGDDPGEPLVAITGSIKNKTNKDMELSSDKDNFYFNCEFKKDDLWWTGEPDGVCQSGGESTVRIPAHGTYVATGSKGIVMEGNGPFNIGELVEDGNDDYRVKDGKKQFLVRLADLNSKVSKRVSVSKGFKDAWVTMKGV